MTMTPAQRIREEAKQATKRALLEAGVAEIIARGGLEDPSIETICARAGYTRGAFYVHFEDREQYVTEMLEWVLTDILEAMLLDATRISIRIDETIDQFTDILTSGEWPDLQNNVRAGYLAIVRGVQAGGQVRIRHAEIMEGIIDHMEARIRRGQEHGELRADVDPRHAAAMIALVGVGEVLWDDVGIDFDRRAVARTLTTLLGPET